jgi:hypothetical protein
MPALHGRLAEAARRIEAQDQAAGKHHRGVRQAISLIECTLKRRPTGEVAGELGLSARQFFRERQAAWTRAIRYLIAPEPSALNEPSFRDVRCNHAIRLFASGQRLEGAAILFEMLQDATGLEGVMLAALGAELHHADNDIGAARNLLARVRTSVLGTPFESSTLCRLTLMLVSELLGSETAGGPKLRLSADLVDSVFLERGARRWMLVLTMRLLIARYHRLAASYDRRGALRAAEAAVALGERIPTLPAREEFDLRLLMAHVDWSEHGFTARAEAALLGNYDTATASGWLPEVAQVGSLLAAMMAIAGKGGYEGYAETALSVAQMLQEDEAARFTCLNLAAAELDIGRPDRAATFLEYAVPTGAAGALAECDVEVALLAREIKAASRTTNVPAIALSDSRELDRAVTLDPLRAAYHSRVAAMELERRDDHRAATRLIAEAWEIAEHEGDWFSHRTIGRTYRQLMRRAPVRGKP